MKITIYLIEHIRVKAFLSPTITITIIDTHPPAPPSSPLLSLLLQADGRGRAAEHQVSSPGRQMPAYPESVQ
jgi:hypothetical protein